MLNQRIALEDLEGVILDFGGVLYDIDYDAPPVAFARLGDPEFASLYHQASQSKWFDQLEMGTLSRESFYGHLKARCHAGTTTEEVHAAWCCILTGMPPARAASVEALGRKTRLFLLSNTNAIHAEVFEADLVANLPDASAFWGAFEQAHYSHDLGIKKPHPETFLAVCEKHGLAPGRTLFLDDSIQHVEGADKAGLHAHHLDLSREDFGGWLSRMGWRL